AHGGRRAVKTPRIDLVEWFDSFGIEDEWHEVNCKHDHKVIVSVGYLVGETLDYLYLATTVDEESETYACAIAIFKPCIKTRSTLAEAGYR
ncbi:MAG: hypothetical protein ACO35C_07730, partial [Pontimonas sp.]